MNFAKLDAALAAALEEVSDPTAPRFPVFVHLDTGAGAAEREALAALGAAVPDRGAVGTATLSAHQIAELSERGWVRRLTLSQPVDLLRGEKPTEAGG